MPASKRITLLTKPLKCCGHPSDLDEVGSLHEHLAWALGEISSGDYSKTPKHECEFKTNPEKGHCDFCWGFWAAVGACFPEKFQTDINDD